MLHSFGLEPKWLQLTEQSHVIRSEAEQRGPQRIYEQIRSKPLVFHYISLISLDASVVSMIWFRFCVLLFFIIVHMFSFVVGSIVLLLTQRAYVIFR